MPYILRQDTDLNNPTLAGGIYGKYITIGRPIYWAYKGGFTYFLTLIGDGGKYGLDSIQELSYNAVPLSSSIWQFHRGTLTAQIEPVEITDVNDTTNVFTANGHGLVDDDRARFLTIGGRLPTPLVKRGKYYVVNATTNTFQVSNMEGGSATDITDQGTQDTLLVYKAVTGIDDPEQGVPTFLPELGLTFSGISYVEGHLPANYSTANEEPDWENFRILGTGRRLMDYDATGAEQGVEEGEDNSLLSNLALEIADVFLNEYQVDPTRIDWASWFDFRNAGEVEILQAVRNDDNTTPSINGITARYYNDTSFLDLVGGKNYDELDFDFGTGSPETGVNSTNYSIRFSFYLGFEYDEVYTFSFTHTDTLKVTVDGDELINEASGGTHTAEYEAEAGVLAVIEVEFTHTTGTSNIDMSWSSASQSSETVPKEWLFTSDVPVKRFECHTAFPLPTEASEVVERLMDRAVGWNITDTGEKIKFLAPDRSIVRTFELDKVDDDSDANFIEGTFSKSKIDIRTRYNFLNFRYRKVQEEGYPYGFVQAEREELRDLLSGVPSNEPYADLGVMTESLASRMAEMQMILKSDPVFTAQISGNRSASDIYKNELVRVEYTDNSDNVVENKTFMVTLVGRGGDTKGKVDFSLLPVPSPLITDEVVIT